MAVLWSNAMHLENLPTPFLVVDERRLSLNLDRMQARARTQAVGLRPHTKTHKSVALAREQVERGAKGIAVAKPSEAEVYVDAGFTDIIIAYTLGADSHFATVAKLLPNAKVRFCVDSVAGARRASAFFASCGMVAEVLLEVDSGQHRCGVLPQDALAVAREVAALPSLHLVGALTHEGHSYNGPREGESREDALRRAMTDGREALLSVATTLGEADLAHPATFILSQGSTPSMRVFENRSERGFRITEVRPGNYVFHDLTQVQLGTCTLEDCALTVLSTVVAVHKGQGGTSRVVLDAGKKILSSDLCSGHPGYGLALYNPRTMRPLPHTVVSRLSEEHAVLDVRGHATLDVGDRLRLVPNHACVVVATQNQYAVLSPTDEVRIEHIDARDGVR